MFNRRLKAGSKQSITASNSVCEVRGDVVGDVDFARLVRRIRQARGQTQEDLARELDVTQQIDLYRDQIRDYLAATGAPEGLLVFCHQWQARLGTVGKPLSEFAAQLPLRIRYPFSPVSGSWRHRTIGRPLHRSHGG